MGLGYSSITAWGVIGKKAQGGQKITRGKVGFQGSKRVKKSPSGIEGAEPLGSSF